MSRRDFIYCEKGSLSQKSCDEFINFFEDNKNFASPGRYTDKEGSIENLEICLDIVKSNDSLLNSVLKGFENYKRIYPLSDRLTWGIYPRCQLMKYEPNKYYNIIHCENDCSKRPAVERCFAWMIYLNTIKRGGGTEFLHQKFIAKPRAGDVYIWPAGWTHMHRGVNAPDEIKYIITGWCNFMERKD